MLPAPKFLCGVVTVVLLCAGLTVPSWAQEPELPYGKYVRTEDFVRALNHFYNDEIPEGLELMKKVARDNPGRTIRWVAYGQIASHTTDKSERIAWCQKMVEEFPGSSGEIIGRQMIIRYQSEGNDALFAIELDKLAQKFGGPSSRVIQFANSAGLAYHIRRLPWESQKALASVYQEMFYKMSTDARTNFTNARFLRLAFPFVKDNPEYAMSEMLISYRIMRFADRPEAYVRAATLNPTIQFDSRRTCGPRPKFRFRSYTGPFPVARISLGAMIFNVDGQDARFSLDLDSQMDTKLTGKVPFETLFFTYRPKQKLAKGRHTIFIQLTTSNYNPSRTVGITKIEVPFQVTEDDDSPDDKAEEQFQDRD